MTELPLLAVIYQFATRFSKISGPVLHLQSPKE